MSINLDGGGGGATQTVDFDVDLTEGLLSSAFTAHTTVPSSEPYFAFDGNDGTSYISENYNYDPDFRTPGAFLAVDFGEGARAFPGGITLVAGSDQGPPASVENGLPRIFQLQISNDGENWTEIYRWDQTDDPPLDGEDVELLIPQAYWPRARVRYVRLKIDATYGQVSEGNGHPVVWIQEMEIHPIVTIP